MVLIATERSMSGSKPSYTTPIAPLPSTRRISYLPRCSGSTTVPLVRSAFEHLHRVDEARLHAADRFGEHPDLVAAVGAEFARLEVAEAHLIGERGKARHARDHRRVQRRVEQD